MSYLSKFFITVSILLFSFSTIYSQKNGDTVIANNVKNLKLKVYYFHSEIRCNTCLSIEKCVRKTLDSLFQNQLETGVIDFYILNAEKQENLMIVKKFDAYGSTLVLAEYLNGKEGKFEDITNWAFKKIYSPSLFIKELSEKINLITK